MHSIYVQFYTVYGPAESRHYCIAWYNRLTGQITYPKDNMF